MAGLGATIVQGRDHNDVWELLGVEHPEGSWTMEEWYPDALPCIARLRAAGYRVCACGNTPAFVEEVLREHVDAVGSSAGWHVWKPAPEFFARVVELAGVPPERIAYVGDRADNDVGPALAAGMVGVHIRRGPWGHLQQPPASAIRIRSLDELPEALQ
jgi:HAD superfamily hydrolase (TIGR01509 family)